MKHLTEVDRQVITEVMEELFELGLEDALKYTTIDHHSELNFWDWEHAHREVLHDNMGLKFWSGATKVGIEIPEVPEWVIKVAFNRSTSNMEDIDFCAREFQYCNEAYEAGLSEFFAQIEYLGKMHNVDVYVQERVYISEGDIHDTLRVYVKSHYGYDADEFENMDDYEMALDDDVYNMDDKEAVYVIFQDNEKVEQLLEFVKTHKINDLHAGNWGYTQDDRIVMFDYSGFVY